MASHRLFTLPVAILVFQSFLLGTSEFIIVGVLPDIASDLNIAVTMVGVILWLSSRSCMRRSHRLAPRSVRNSSDSVH